MPAQNTDKFIKGSRRWSGQIGASGITDGITLTAPLVSTTGLPSDTAVEITIDRVDANGSPTPSKEEVIRGVVSGTNIVNCVRGVEGSAQAHGAGAVVEIRLTADQWNRMIDGVTVEHNQDGTHKLHGLVEKTTPVDADEVGLIDSAASFVLKKLSFLNLKTAIGSFMNPIGTIREFNVATNPATLLGFGTWSAFGTGRVTVAIDAGQVEFDVNGETGGAKTHTLTATEMPIHNHPENGAMHYVGSGGNLIVNGGTNFYDAAGSVSTGNAGSGGAHNNLQPYIVVYRWVRTA